MKKGYNTVKLYNPVGNKIDSATLLYRRMAKALKNATKRVASENGTEEKPILFSICEWGFRKPWLWGKTAGNMWRTTPDIRPWWPWIKVIYERNVRLYRHANAGHYNDPDMLEVGNGSLTYNQNLSHFTLWCFMNAPLVLGNDLRKMPDSVKDIVTNPDLISINQDSKCMQAKRVRKGSVDVLAKPVEDGTAICFFNKTALKQKMIFNLEALVGDNYVNAKFGDEITIKNIVGEAAIKGKKVSATIPKDGVVAFIVK